MEQQVRGERSWRYIFREVAAAWSNRCEEGVVSAIYSGREQLHGATGAGERMVSETLSGRERLHGTTGARRE